MQSTSKPGADHSLERGHDDHCSKGTYIFGVALSQKLITTVQRLFKVMASRYTVHVVTSLTSLYPALVKDRSGVVANPTTEAATGLGLMCSQVS
jgi:hypothetical protein